MALVGAIGYYGIVPALTTTSRTDRPLVAVIKRGTLRITVTERGSVESSTTVDGICELNGANKISFLIPEGSKVQKGDVVCKFDDSEIKKNIAHQEVTVKQGLTRIETTRQDLEITRSSGLTTVMAADVDLKLAQLDLEKFHEGDYPMERTKQQGIIGLKKKDLNEARNKVEQFHTLMKKGFKTPEQYRLQEMDQARLILDLDSAEKELMVKEKYDYKRKTTEYESKLEQAKQRLEQAKAIAKAQNLKATSENEAAKATSRIEEEQLKEFLHQKEKTVMCAVQPGIVAYANDAYYDPSRQIREGSTVYFQQKIFSLPDMTRMQVKVNIHESLIKKIKTGQKAEIRVDAFPNVVFLGTVKSISQLADSTRPWTSGGVKEYPTVVTIDGLRGFELKPAMTAEARILINELSNVLVVPVQAIAEHKGEFYAYLEEPAGIQKRKVKVGDNDEKHTEVIEGLNEGESVALDARRRLEAELKTEESKNATKPGAKTDDKSPRP